jgi:hypothetical protein
VQLNILRCDRKPCLKLLDGMVNVVLLQVSSSHVFTQSGRGIAGSVGPLVQFEGTFGVPRLHQGQPIVGQHRRVFRL